MKRKKRLANDYKTVPPYQANLQIGTDPPKSAKGFVQSLKGYAFEQKKREVKR